MQTVNRNSTMLALVALLVGLLSAAPAAADLAAQIRQLTGAETRIVWLRNKQWETDKPNVDGGVGFSIMAFDTGGKGERELVPEGELHNQLITPSGRRVIYSAVTDGKLRIHCSISSGRVRVPCTFMRPLQHGQDA